MITFDDDEGSNYEDYDPRSAQPIWRRGGKTPQTDLLNKMIGHARIIANHAERLNDLDPVKSKSLDGMNEALIKTSTSLYQGNKFNADRATASANEALSHASLLANQISKKFPNSLAHHEAQGALSDFVAAHGELVKSLARGNR